MCGDMKVDACGPAIASCSRVCGDVCVCVCVCTIDVLHHMLRRCSRCSCVMPPTAQSKCISPTHNVITGHVHIHIHTYMYIHTHRVYMYCLL